MTPRFVPFIALLLAVATAAQAQFAGFINHGLVGVGRVPADTFDRAGDGRQDTLGGFSAMAVEPGSLAYAGGTISGKLVGLPDRGFGDGSTDYRPRLERFGFAITPHYGPSAAGQGQITFTNVGSVLFTHGAGAERNFFTGFDAGDTNHPGVPRSAANSPGNGRRALDPEGLVLLPGGGCWVSDEYGPALYRFDAHAHLVETFFPPAALLPAQGGFPGKVSFTANAMPASGRRNNRGFEGLSLTPDGKRLIAFLQSPTVQDGGSNYLGRNTRILQFDADAKSASYGRLVAEHIYQLTLDGSAAGDRHTPVSEVLALDATTFLVLERDSLGRGSLEANVAPRYKRVVLASTRGASNLAGTAYDLAPGAPGQRSLPGRGTELPAGLKPVVRQDFVDLLEPGQLAKFGLNTRTNWDADTLGEKWEALALIPLRERAHPDDFLLLVGSDNDFRARVVYHNGVPVGINAVTVDPMLLAYRVTLPGIGAH